MSFIAYGLTIDDAITPELIADYACRCGAKRCTGSMLAPRRLTCVDPPSAAGRWSQCRSYFIASEGSATWR